MMIQNLTRAQNGCSVVNHRPAIIVAWRLAVALALLAALLPVHSVFAQQRIFIPLVATTQNKPQRSVIGSGDLQASCNLSDKEAAAAKLIAEDSEQRRAKMVCNPILAEVARAKAKDMAEREYFSHTNPDGVGPNLLVTQAGYELPDWYSHQRDANNVESIAAGYDTAQDVVNGWEGSDGHRRHILGLNDFYKGQEAFGIGYYRDPDSPYTHYWVFLSAHEEGVAVTGGVTTLPEAPPEGTP